ncbi:hypothetical protein LTR09_012640 [Extremus antarcticus]|uniref:Uncharacterized protein n=1 Tax=Extremus antarcticus TaxID=702011 RepID=A0AAJ0D9Q2_9PEZI|nr:hypothetical protein LTR09_012640 [Extremus antarcticus]
MNKYKKPLRKLQAWESTLQDEYNRGTLPEELSPKLQAQGMVFAALPEPSEPWELVIETRPMSALLPPPSPVEEESPAEDSCVDQGMETPQASTMAEEAVEVPVEKGSWPNPEGQKAQKDAAENFEVVVAGGGSESERQEELEWTREGYGICIGCADMYILRCNGEESPWAEGSDRPEEKDGKLLIECGDCQSQGEARRLAKKKGGFGGGFDRRMRTGAWRRGGGVCSGRSDCTRRSWTGGSGR